MASFREMLAARNIVVNVPFVDGPVVPQQEELIDLGAFPLEDGIDLGPITNHDNDLIDLGAEEIPQPAPKKPVPKGDKLDLLFGDWVALVRHHSTHTHGNNCRVEITRPIQNRLWEEYNINSSPFHARDIGKILPKL